MQLLCLPALCALLYVAAATPVVITVVDVEPSPDLRVCGHGPSYWCTNLKNAKQCSAIKHCIQTVWEKQQVPEDNDDVCTICKDMVAQARAQLESNETQEELKEVFEGSCKLIPVQEITDECIKLADEFIPELVEALASQMNPTVVCSVAGLCNSERIDQLLVENKKHSTQPTTTTTLDDCDGCYIVINQLDKRFVSLPKDEVLNNMLEVCGRFGSFSDGCSAIVVAYFSKIYQHLSDNLKGNAICQATGVCTNNAQRHHEVKVIHESGVGVLEPGKEDLPCELCEQLVKHLRDILVTNTTENEFEDVLKGLCKQTGSFSSECLSLVDSYYSQIYNFLVNDLNPEEACTVAGLCERTSSKNKGAIWPLLPANHEYVIRPNSLKPMEKIFAEDEANAAKLNNVIPATELEAAERITGDEEGNAAKLIHVMPATKLEAAERITGDDEGNAVKLIHVMPATKLEAAERITGDDEGNAAKRNNVIPATKLEAAERLTGDDEVNSVTGHRLDAEKPEFAQLPIERLIPQTLITGNKESCELCEYFLHYLQVTLTSPATEAEIKQAVEEICDHLPKSINPQCRDFINTYGDAFIALLAQEIDPSQICPMLSLCPGEGKPLQTQAGDKPGCAMCLLAVQELDTLLKGNKTEESIRNALDNMCDMLPKSLSAECKDFVETYADQLVDMLVADFTPEEVCAYLDLCDKSGDDILSNDIPALSAEQQLPDTRLMPQVIVQNEVKKLKDDTPQCVICEFIMSELEKSLKDNATEEEIKQAVHQVCNYMPKTVARECNDFVDEYADMVIQLLIASLEPAEICAELSLCNGKKPKSDDAGYEECTICKTVVDALDKLLEDKGIEQDVDQTLEKVCPLIPTAQRQRCKTVIDAYGPQLMNLIGEVAGSKYVCEEVDLCKRNPGRVRLLGGKKCTWGPSYWCQSEFHAKSCKATKHCQEKVWKGERPAH